MTSSAVVLELLEQLKEDTQQQRQDLDDIRFVLTLLLNAFELQHLRNLAAGDTREYVGCGSLRAELRKLRDLGLIEKLANHHIGELLDQRRFDLKTFVRLTERGTRYLTRLEEYQVPGA